MQDAITAASTAEIGTFTGKFGTGASAKTVTFAVTGASASALATAVQSGIQKYSGLENVTVAATGNAFTITDPNGNAVAGADFKFLQADGTALTDPATVAVTAGTPSTGTSTAGSLFNGAGKEIHSLDLKTLATSNTAITNLDGALKAVNAERSNLGSVMNRLTYAVDNLAGGWTLTTHKAPHSWHVRKSSRKLPQRCWHKQTKHLNRSWHCSSNDKRSLERCFK